MVCEAGVTFCDLQSLVREAWKRRFVLFLGWRSLAAKLLVNVSIYISDAFRVSQKYSGLEKVLNMSVCHEWFFFFPPFLNFQ